jgi:T4-like virus tail tube protein gp19
MAFSVNRFKTEGLFNHGARPTLFAVQLSMPGDSIGGGGQQIENTEALQDPRTTFLVKAASLPGLNLDAIDVGYFGRKIKVDGDRTFDPWTVTIMNDEDMQIRRAMESWSNGMNQLEANLRTVTPASIKADMLVTQYAKGGQAIASYRFIGAFPTVVAPIALDWDRTNQVEEFDVTFAYDYWVPEAATDFMGVANVVPVTGFIDQLFNYGVGNGQTGTGPA